MQLLRADADLRAEAEFKAICEASGCVMINRCRINFQKETLRMRLLFSHDTFRMHRAESCEYAPAPHQAVNNPYIQNIIIIFRCIIRIRSSFSLLYKLQSCEDSLAAQHLRLRNGQRSSSDDEQRNLRATSSVSIELQTEGRCTLALNAISEAMSGSAPASINVWQMPAPVSMTGTVAFSTTLLISDAPPRGIMTSSRPFSLSISSTEERSGSSISCSASAGRSVCAKRSAKDLDNAAVEFRVRLSRREEQRHCLF